MSDAREQHNQALDDAMARARLRERRGKRVHPGPPTLARFAARTLGKYAKTRKPGLETLKDQWPELAGETLAKICEPEKLTGRAGGATLTLRVIPAASTLLTHQTEMLRQRLQAAMGTGELTLKLVQGQLQGKQVKRPVKPVQRRLSDEENDRIRVAADRAISPELQAALLAFGKAVYSQDNQR